jgi:mono/diheme cytochrome c family protein
MIGYFRPLALIPTVTVALMACTPPDDASTRGQRLYANHCAACHGSTAQGNGPLADTLGMQSPDLTILSKNNGGTFPADDVITQIHGYSGRHLYGGMPEYEQILQSPKVNYETQDGDIIPTPQSMIDLATYLEEIQD